MYQIDCNPAPKINFGKKIIMDGFYVNRSFFLELNVTYKCDSGFMLLPFNISRWSCLVEGNWSHSTLPQCLKSKFFICYN